jgi:hypothetical protein
MGGGSLQAIARSVAHAITISIIFMFRGLCHICHNCVHRCTDQSLLSVRRTDDKDEIIHRPKDGYAPAQAKLGMEVGYGTDQSDRQG